MSNKLKESNQAALSAHVAGCLPNKAFREAMQAKYKIDIADKEKFNESKIDWKALHDKMRFREADGVTGFVQLLRAGISNAANASYNSVDVTYDEWTTTVTTDLIEQPYAPLQGLTFPREVGPQQKYPQLRAAGLDLKIRSRKFGALYPVELELSKFDQTGQILQMQGKYMGEYLRLVMEVYVYGKLASPSGGATYQQLTVPVSETKPADEATYPWSTALIGGGRTRPDTFAVFNQANIQAADIILMNQRNMLGIKMMAKGSRILVGPANKFAAAVLLNSSFFPTAQASGTGTFQSINPIQGLYNLTVARFMCDQNGSFDSNSSAWYLVDDTKPFFVVQVTEPIVMEQEDPRSGESFERDIIRFKARTMFNCDLIDPRFAVQYNNGSV